MALQAKYIDMTTPKFRTLSDFKNVYNENLLPVPNVSAMLDLSTELIAINSIISLSISVMSVLCQCYVSTMSVLFQCYISAISVILLKCQFQFIFLYTVCEHEMLMWTMIYRASWTGAVTKSLETRGLTAAIQLSSSFAEVYLRSK